MSKKVESFPVTVFILQRNLVFRYSTLDADLTMKNSFYFNSPSMTQKRNHFRMVILLIFIFILVSYFAIPQMLNSAPITHFEPPKGQIIKVIPPPDLNEIIMAQQQAESEQEVAYLLHQKYLDPLAKYLEANRFNKAKAPYVKKVKMELEQRCSEIEKRYQSMRKDQVSLRNLKKGYEYACPTIIDRLATTLSQ